MIWPTGSSTFGNERRFAYRIINNGKAAAHDVRVRLFNERGEDVSIKPQTPFALEPGEADDRHGVTVPMEIDAMDVRFGASWLDTGHRKMLFQAIPPTF